MDLPWRNGDTPRAHRLGLVVTGPVRRGDFTLSTAEASSTRSCVRRREQKVNFLPGGYSLRVLHFPLLSYPLRGPLLSRWPWSPCPPPCRWRRRRCEEFLHRSPGLWEVHGCRRCLRRGEHQQVLVWLTFNESSHCGFLRRVIIIIVKWRLPSGRLLQQLSLAPFSLYLRPFSFFLNLFCLFLFSIYLLYSLTLSIACYLLLAVVLLTLAAVTLQICGINKGRFILSYSYSIFF